MATVYYPRGETVELTRENVAAYMERRKADARRDATRQPHREERTMGYTRADIWQDHLAALREVERLECVLRCIDAGLPELPREYYP
jgi:hypothetical protein